eukprot:COSAG03_NODE_24592_length_271_cov_0.680233_1_plen_36_part_10
MHCELSPFGMPSFPSATPTEGAMNCCAQGPERERQR